MRISFAASFALFFATSALAQMPAWHVSEVSGDVRIVENGQPHPAARGVLVPAGAIVVTAAGARAVIVRAHDYVVVSPASRVRVPTVQQQGGSGLIQMMTDAGTALFRIEHQATPHFGVRTPYLAAVVKGTVFTVTVGERAASVQVTEGAVQVSTVDGGAAEMIRPGMVATISATDLQLLHVEGETSRDIRSNGSPSPGVVTVPASEAGRYEGPAETPVAVSAAVREDPVSLADATGGLLGGSISGSSGDRAFAEVQVAARIDNHGGATGTTGNGNSGNGNGTDTTGNGTGNAGNGNGGSSDNSGSGNAGNGNGNGGGGSDNSDSGNAGNGNSGSNDSGGAGNAGNGNGGGSDNSGSGNAGNGNGNSGNGNGNGGGGSDNSGSGNGGGNDNSGNGSGNSGSGNSGHGNGGGNDNSGSGNTDDGNNGHGNDDDGFDESNPGHGNGGGHGRKPPR